MLKFGKLVGLSTAFAFAASMGVASALPLTAVDQTVNQVNALSISVGGENEAETEGYAFQYASGNIGANVAAGVENQQANMAFIDPPGPADYNYHGAFNQAQAGVASLGGDSNEAAVDDWSFQHASGNIGLNVASGGQNQQINGLVVLENSADTSIKTNQLQIATGSAFSGENEALIDNYAFQYACGNIGVNVAAGDLNQQANAAIVQSPATDTDLNTVSTTTNQVAVLNLNILSESNNAHIQDNAFQHASGNIGANVASGVGNQQSNTLVVEP